MQQFFTLDLAKTGLSKRSINALKKKRIIQDRLNAHWFCDECEEEHDYIFNGNETLEVCNRNLHSLGAKVSDSARTYKVLSTWHCNEELKKVNSLTHLPNSNFEQFVPIGTNKDLQVWWLYTYPYNLNKQDFIQIIKAFPFKKLILVTMEPFLLPSNLQESLNSFNYATISIDELLTKALHLETFSEARYFLSLDLENTIAYLNNQPTYLRLDMAIFLHLIFTKYPLPLESSYFIDHYLDLFEMYDSSGKTKEIPDIYKLRTELNQTFNLDFDLINKKSKNTGYTLHRSIEIDKN